jgi:hypothetical protein
MSMTTPRSAWWFRRQLEYHGLQVYTAEGSERRKSASSKMTPDGLFIDIWLGATHAFELARVAPGASSGAGSRVVFRERDVPGDT